MQDNQTNEAQSLAIRHGDGPALILAGPGSGKTYVITQRIRCLIKEKEIPPESILVITFTKAASLEMKSRFLALMETKYVPVTFGTFHAIYFQILCHTFHYTFHNILKEYEKQEYLQDILETILPKTAEGILEPVTPERIRDFLGEISHVKNAGLDYMAYRPLRLEPELFHKVYEAYEEQKLRRVKLDFDDMIFACYRLFLEHPEILNRWRERFRYILIDEFQDINLLQYKIIKMLAAPLDNLFIVGDDDQSIYGFRGARPDIMRDFLEDYNAKKICLSVNYRSVPAIVEAAGKVIGVNLNRFPKQIRAYLPETAADSFVIQGFSDIKEENENVIHFLEQCHGRGVLDKTAVILRTNLAASYLAERLSIKLLPFTIREKLYDPYKHFIAKDICAYLRLAVAAWKRPDFLLIMNRPKRYIGRVLLQGKIGSLSHAVGILKTAFQDSEYRLEPVLKLEYDLRVMAKMDPFAAVNYIRKGVDYEGFLREYAKLRGTGLKDWMDILADIQERARAFQTIPEWLLHMEGFDEKLQKAGAKKEGPTAKGVAVLTMHASKGLEFPYVLLPGLNEGRIPHNKSLLPMELEEERRMLYVAMTRAKERLLLFYEKGDGGPGAPVPSRFLKEFLKNS